MVTQILSITCDNASSNAAMIEELELLLDNFPGAANRARCFTHILNLVVKSIMRLFDVPKDKKDGLVDEELLNLAGEIEAEEDATIHENLADGDVADGSSNDNVEGWVDERIMMSRERLEELEDAIRPVRFLLTKVYVSDSHIT